MDVHIDQPRGYVLAACINYLSAGRGGESLADFLDQSVHHHNIQHLVQSL